MYFFGKFCGLREIRNWYSINNNAVSKYVILINKYAFRSSPYDTTEVKWLSQIQTLSLWLTVPILENDIIGM